MIFSRLKNIGIAAIFAFSIQSVFAQEVEPLALDLPQAKVKGSLYNHIQLLDLRPDTSGIGIVQKGLFNRQVKLIAQESLEAQFNNILKSLNDESAKTSELVIQLRQLFFSELTSNYSEHGYFGFGATVYAKKDSLYIPVKSIDTMVVVSGMDVTKKNIRSGSGLIVQFLHEAIQKTPEGSSGYTYNELLNFADVTKKTLKLYTSDTCIDGYYSSYKSFSNQVPDGHFFLDGKEVNQKNVKVVDKKGVLRKIKPETVYAIVYQGKPYISTPLNYYPLTKTGNEFYFTGKLSDVKNNSGSGVAMGAMYGAIGGALYGALAASYNGNPIYEVKIYYLTGDFIRLKEIK